MTAKLDDTLLRLAVQALRDADFSEISLRSLAKRIGVSMPTLYKRFGSKNGLVQAMVEFEFARMLEGVSQIAIAGLAPEDALRRHARDLFDQFGGPTTVKFVKFLNQHEIDSVELRQLRKEWHLRIVSNTADLIGRMPSAAGMDRARMDRLAMLLIDLLRSPAGLYTLGFEMDEAMNGLSPSQYFDERYALFQAGLGLGSGLE